MKNKRNKILITRGLIDIWKWKEERDNYVLQVDDFDTVVNYNKSYKNRTKQWLKKIYPKSWIN